MTDLAVIAPRIPAMSPAAIDKVRQLESLASERPQVAIMTEHVLHAGMYARTIRIPADTMITGVLVKLATLLIVQGDAVAYIGEDEPMRLRGYTVLPASKGRKQAFVALAETHMTMLFPTAARSVEEAEHEFTDETDILLSRRDVGNNHVVITGE